MRLSFPHPTHYWYEVGMLKVQAYGDTRRLIVLQYTVMRCTRAAPRSHGMYSIANLHLQLNLQLERRGFCVQEFSLPIKSAPSFTAVSFREMPSSADEVTASHRDICGSM